MHRSTHTAALGALRLAGPGLAFFIASSSGPLAAQQTAAPVAALEAFRSVTDAMLANPPPGDWLSFRRTLDAWGYSPLAQH